MRLLVTRKIEGIHSYNSASGTCKSSVIIYYGFEKKKILTNFPVFKWMFSIVENSPILKREDGTSLLISILPVKIIVVTSIGVTSIFFQCLASRWREHDTGLFEDMWAEHEARRAEATFYSHACGCRNMRLISISSEQLFFIFKHTNIEASI